MLKFGFKQGAVLFDGSESELYIDLMTFTGWIADTRDNNYCSPAPIKNVHQLQNLYFALTQKELVLLNK